MDTKEVYFSIGKKVNIPFTYLKERYLVLKYGSLVVNLITKYTSGTMHTKNGKAVFYVRNFLRINHRLSIMMALLEQQTYADEQSLHKAVVKLYKQRTKYMSYYKQNTTKAEREASYFKEFSPGILQSELIHRGFVTQSSSSDQRYKEDKYYIQAAGFVYPVSEPSFRDIKKLFAKIKVRNLTKINKHGY